MSVICIQACLFRFNLMRARIFHRTCTYMTPVDWTQFTREVFIESLSSIESLADSALALRTAIMMPAELSS